MHVAVIAATGMTTGSSDSQEGAAEEAGGTGKHLRGAAGAGVVHPKGGVAAGEGQKGGAGEAAMLAQTPSGSAQAGRQL